MKISKALYLIIVVILAGSCGPTNEELKNQKVQEYSNQYFKSLQYGDKNIALEALYGILSLDTSNVAVKDSIMSFYFREQSYYNASLVGLNILSAELDNTKALEVTAVGLDKIGAKEKSLILYDRLFDANSDTLIWYKTALINFQLKQFDASNSLLNKLVPTTFADSTFISMNTSDGGKQSVNLKAAAYNVKGMVQTQLKNYKEAERFYDIALKITPGFDLAKNNLLVVKNSLK